MMLTSPQGTLFTQAVARAVQPAAAHSCCCAAATRGSTSGCATRVDEEMSIGDYVLSGGEMPALVVIDAVARLVPGVVGDEQSVAEDSFGRGLLDFPHYTRPAEIAAGPGREAAEGAGRAVVGESCGDSAVAETGSARAHDGAAAGSAGATPNSTKKSGRCCAN